MFRDSPLRYPGGKARLANFIKLLLVENKLLDGHYVEPYTGGGSVALALLFGDYVRRIHINDLDSSIHAFWHAVLYQTDDFCKLVASADLTIDEWREQRRVYRSDETDTLARGFATFYLNRTNRSGIIGNGGVIGGLQQAGKWLIDARYPRDELVRRIRRVAAFRSRVSLTRLDALDLLHEVVPCLPKRALVYLDPPYYVKGQGLYANAYRPDDHAAVAAEVMKLSVPWVVSYDDHQELRTIYAGAPYTAYGLGYSARERKDGQEVMFFSHGLRIPHVPDPTTVTIAMVNHAA
jgi:DNA adenine methylase